MQLDYESWQKSHCFSCHKWTPDFWYAQWVPYRVTSACFSQEQSNRLSDRVAGLAYLNATISGLIYNKDQHYKLELGGKIPISIPSPKDKTGKAVVVKAELLAFR